ncbi:DUF3742 family protein [Pseudomonas sp. NPDC077186]|uniref:DUF3742 family protein n=1 Tax=Pseudomonas TaxID=286 RepID=UPI00071B6F8F|nr:DUF3742 family protein [Pseudomonas aeruginosa]HBM65169.1 DUF3742 domain-containing protein [Pseudomonas sp.]AXL70952.1 hypothetical protein Y31_2999 [Pseudomonas aeruginosa]KSS00979.1 hypothetical protein APB52_02180 [Pseudomonas aeruginosa]MCO4013580.1 DUF3742 family protein [Pseudomonas aeruginosa]PNP71847.1 DUF3742 domain-containing protein [Pseudomonas aeruginosa]
MKPSAQTTFAERAGRILGLMWRAYMRQEWKVSGWVVAQGMPTSLAKAMLVVVKLVVLGALLYVVFWLALLLVSIVAAAWAARDSDHESEEWAVGEQAEYKNNPGYHPILYNDAPDSRYADPRYDDD